MVFLSKKTDGKLIDGSQTRQNVYCLQCLANKETARVHNINYKPVTNNYRQLQCNAKQHQRNVF